jgi:hypothetical protein
LPTNDSSFCILDVVDVQLASHWYFVVRTDRHLSHAARSFLKFAELNLEQCLDKNWVNNELSTLNTSLA